MLFEYKPTNGTLFADLSPGDFVWLRVSGDKRVRRGPCLVAHSVNKVLIDIATGEEIDANDDFDTFDLADYTLTVHS
jgi:hypothetical protein